jgi:hypothetical protein
MSIHALRNPRVCNLRGFTLLSLTITLADADDTPKADRGGVSRGKNQKNTGSDSREHREPNVSKSERNAAGTRRDGPNYSLRQPKPLLGVVGDSEDANPRVGGSSGT